MGGKGERVSESVLRGVCGARHSMKDFRSISEMCHGRFGIFRKVALKGLGNTDMSVHLILPEGFMKDSWSFADNLPESFHKQFGMLT